jgi:hypothetical protein
MVGKADTVVREAAKVKDNVVSDVLAWLGLEGSGFGLA